MSLVCFVFLDVPTLEGVHSPDERIHLDTVPKFWDFLLGILKAVN